MAEPHQLNVPSWKDQSFRSRSSHRSGYVNYSQRRVPARRLSPHIHSPITSISSSSSTLISPTFSSTPLISLMDEPIPQHLREVDEISPSRTSTRLANMLREAGSFFQEDDLISFADAENDGELEMAGFRSDFTGKQEPSMHLPKMASNSQSNHQHSVPASLEKSTGNNALEEDDLIEMNSPRLRQQIISPRLNHHFASLNPSKQHSTSAISLDDIKVVTHADLMSSDPIQKPRRQQSSNRTRNGNTNWPDNQPYSLRHMANALPTVPSQPNRRDRPLFYAKTQIEDSNAQFRAAEQFAPETSVKDAAVTNQTLNKSSRDYHLQHLKDMIISDQSMTRQAYVLHPLEQFQIDDKKRCVTCNKTIGNYDPDESWDEDNIRISAQGKLKMPPLLCKYHSGSLKGKKWTCCNKMVWEATPCRGTTKHKPRIYAQGELEEYWQYHSTPENSRSPNTRRDVVAFDCEMGISKLGEPELIRVTMVDYFTSEVLVDKLVYPNVGMKDLNTRYSGVSWDQLDQAKRRGDCFLGRDAAREAVWRFVDINTIVIAHSGENDFKSMRWIHRNVVDTFTIEHVIREEEQKRIAAEKEKEEQERAESETPTESTTEETKPTIQQSQPKNEGHARRVRKPKGSGDCSLKTITRKRLGREIQIGFDGHDSKEDALAARDVAQWHVVQRVTKSSDFKELMKGSSTSN